MITRLPAPMSAARFRITGRAWKRLLRELERRGAGTRESGAFLLARPDDARRRVVAIAFYDDLDPDCLWGGITFSRDGFACVWRLCRDEGLTVIGDVHTHPGAGVVQSSIDAANPMVAVPGHVAIIVPRYARGTVGPSAVGVHVYEHNFEWASHYGRDAARVLKLAPTLWRTT